MNQIIAGKRTKRQCVFSFARFAYKQLKKRAIFSLAHKNLIHYRNLWLCIIETTLFYLVLNNISSNIIRCRNKGDISLRKIIFVCLVSFTLAACGGRTPNPVMVTQYGDNEKSCEALEFEMGTIENEMQRLLPKTDKTGKNVALGVAGWFLLVPWFFMDFKNAEQTEYEAYRQRYNNIATLAMSKKCNVKPANYPSVEQMKQEYEAQQRTQEAN